MDLKEAKQRREDAKKTYLALAADGHDHEKKMRVAHDAVKAATSAVSDAITAGAKPCPGCNTLPHGVEHQVTRGRSVGLEYEVGCIHGCKTLEHTDGTIRRYAARGGPIPRHAVEAWNEGPEFWMVAKPKEEAEPLPAAPSTDAPAA